MIADNLWSRSLPTVAIQQRMWQDPENTAQADAIADEEAFGGSWIRPQPKPSSDVVRSCMADLRTM